MFFRSSRYEGVKETEFLNKDGRTIRYKRMRFLPPTEGTLAYTVTQNDRPDLIASQFFRNPEVYWRIADANRVMKVESLVEEPARRLLIPLPTS